ncbi:MULTISPECIES: sulfite oxidase [Arthrobacter]|uniref:Sulfite oxidase n=2 Tax=Arthrobacter TaxID=1663 RepID=A0ABU9KRQ3_9MICC|nr:sulfite oxidase [Arthrobacter sp. YJM1]MDP5228587.1 sulfite oxidase [Arthrobacter sp. YJM1]
MTTQWTTVFPGLPERQDEPVTHAARGSGGPTDGPLTDAELQLAARNHALPLEILREEVTPPGLHYLLIHFDIPAIDAGSWRLSVAGAVQRELSFSLEDLRARPAVTVPVTLECAGNGRSLLRPRPLSQPWVLEAVGTAGWTGTPLAPILREAGLHDDAVEFVFTGADRGIQGGREEDYARSLTLEDIERQGAFLAYAMNGAPLPPQHGFPVRLMVPGWYGMTSVKWLSSIEAVTRPFDGYQQAVAYRYLQDPQEQGTPVNRIRVRSLMVPPGIPDFFTRRRIVDSGTVRLQGRAWSGHGTVESVEMGVDGTWSPAELEPALGGHAWRGWSVSWDAEPGDHELRCRATDSTGAVQPLEPEWNLQGMGNNVAQRVEVTVRAPRV